MNYYEITGVVFGLLCVWLTTRQSIWNWPIGIVNVSAFIFMFYNAKLYPDMWLHVVYLFMGIYGWAKWGMGSINWGEPVAKLPVSRVSRKELIGWAMAVPVLVTAMGYYFATHTQSAAPYVDSTITVVSLVANYLLCRKILENWILWMITDVIAISLYTYKELYLTAGLYVIYFILCIIGYKSWKKELQA